MNRELKRIALRPVRPLLDRFDRIIVRLDSIDGRLERLERRMDEMEAFVQATAARVNTVSERTLTGVESAARTAQRVLEIEKLLGAAEGE